MNQQDVEGFCAANNIEFMEVGSEDKLGAGMLFHWTRPGGPPDDECVHLTPRALEEITPAQLLRSVVNGRDVMHITRIVGYYSRTENWNKSKVGELKARRNGDYGVSIRDAH